MASPFTDAERAQIFEIFGIPVSGDAIIGIEFAHFPGTPIPEYLPTWATADFSTLVDQVDAVLADITSDTATRSRVLLARWDEVTASSPLLVSSSQTGGGTLADHPTERDNIRTQLGNQLGITVPWGGFSEQMKQYYGTSRNQATLGDR